MHAHWNLALAFALTTPVSSLAKDTATGPTPPATAIAAQTQQVQWSHVSIHNLNPKLDRAVLSPAERAAVGVALQRQERDKLEDDLEVCLCNAKQWRQRLRFFRAPLGRAVLILVRPPLAPGPPNEARWLVEIRDSSVLILASPQQGFTGWGLGIQSHTSHGLHDVVLGWHVSAAETSLGYFRYDGRMYRRIASEDITPCASGVGKDCYSDGSPTFDSF